MLERVCCFKKCIILSKWSYDKKIKLCAYSYHTSQQLGSHVQFYNYKSSEFGG